MKLLHFTNALEVWSQLLRVGINALGILIAILLLFWTQIKYKFHDHKTKPKV